MLTNLKVYLVIDQIKMQFFLYELVSQTRFQINILFKQLSFKLEKLNPADCLILSSKHKMNNQANKKELVMNYIKLAKLEEVSMNLAANTMKMKNFVIFYDYVNKNFSIFLNYFLINDKEDEDERLL